MRASAHVLIVPQTAILYKQCFLIKRSADQAGKPAADGGGGGRGKKGGGKQAGRGGKGKAAAKVRGK